MKNSMKSKKTGRLKRLCSAILLALCLSLSVVPTALAQDDAAPAAVTLDAAPEATPAWNGVGEPPKPGDPPRVEEVAPDPAPTADSDADTGLGNFTDTILTIVLPSLGTLVAGLVAMLLLWMRKRFKLQISEQSIMQWSEVAGKAANRGGEWARNKAKKLTDDAKVPGPDVLDVAVDWATETGKALGLPAMGREKLAGWIEGHLFENRDDSV